MSLHNIDNSADELVNSLLKGESGSFQLVWNRYNLPIKKFIYDMCGDYTIAEELAQETFFRVFKGIKSYRRETKFSSWIFGIAKNVVLENFRSQKKHDLNVEIKKAEKLTVGEETNLIESKIFESEMLEAVNKALAEIESEQKICFVLRVFQGKTYSEITEITGFSLSKVKVDIYRTRVKMRDSLGLLMENKDEL